MQSRGLPTRTPEEAYKELIRRSRESALLGSCIEVLGWDEETYMPREGAPHRAAQQAYLAALQHDRDTQPDTGDLLASVETSSLIADPNSIAAINVRELRRLYDRDCCIPRRLIEELAQVTTLAQQAWADARNNDDYPSFASWLHRVIKLTREKAQAIASRQPGSLYDVLLEDYEVGLKEVKLVELFDQLRPSLTGLLSEILARGPLENEDVLRGDYSIDRQRTFGEMVAAAVGFNFQAGRIDVANHPSCTSIGPGDCRITTRYNPQHLGDALFSILHEVGHALYEQGLDAKHLGTPYGEAPSLVLHESQARLWENTVGRSAPFWHHFFPLARQIFHDALASVDVNTFIRAVQRVAPSCIRVQADEVTYNLHILIRFELEQALLSGDLRVDELPSAWNEAYLRDLGIQPESDREGCLQDGHWAAGMIGYFPTYTLGNIVAAQLYHQALKDCPDLEVQMSRGVFLPLVSWLRQNVHQAGGRWLAPELLQRITGLAPEPRFLVSALRYRYGPEWKDSSQSVRTS